MKSSPLVSEPDADLSPRGSETEILQFIVMEENKSDAELFVSFWTQEFKKRNLDFAIARNYAQHKKNTIFLRQEIATPDKQQAANTLHEEICNKLGIEK